MARGLHTLTDRFKRLIAREVHEDSDAQLLHQFIDHRDEIAFTALVHRHGPMVMGVCRRILGGSAVADDAFQVTFLALASKASSLRNTHALGGWLYRVAYHSAVRAKANEQRRREVEQHAMTQAPTETNPDRDSQELGPILDVALASLPEKFRAPLLLCGVEGKTNQEAADTLGIPVGSISKRLAKGRELLRKQLARRGYALSASAVAALIGPELKATVPEFVPRPIASAAIQLASGRAVTGLSTSVTHLLTEVLQTMSWSTTKLLTAFAVVGLLITGAGVPLLLGYGKESPKEQPASLTKADEVKKPSPEVPAPEKKNMVEPPLPEGAVMRFGSSAFRFASHVGGFEYSADGKEILVMESMYLRVIDSATGVQKQEFKVGHGHLLSFAQGPKEKKAFVEGNKTILWDLKTAKKLLEISSHRSGASLAKLSPDGKIIAIWGDDQEPTKEKNGIEKGEYTVRLFDAETGKAIPGFGEGIRCGARFAFAPDSRSIAVSPKTGEVQRLSVKDGKELGVYRADSVYLFELAYSPTGKVIAGTNTDGLVMWDVETQKVLHTCTTDDDNHAGPLAFTSDGAYIAEGHGFFYTGGQTENRVRIWGVKTGIELASFKVPHDGKGSGSNIYAMSFSPDDKHLALAVCDQRLHIFDPLDEKQNPSAISTAMSATTIAPDATVAITGHTDGTIRQWDRWTRQTRFKIDVKAPVHQLQFSKELDTFLGVTDNVVHRWDAKTGESHQRWNAPKDVYWRAISPDGLKVAGGSDSGKITILDLKTSKTSTLDPSGERGRIVALAFTPDGTKLLTGSGEIPYKVPTAGAEKPDYHIRCWDLATGKEHVVGLCEMAPTSLAVSPDGKHVFANANTRDKGWLPEWDIASGKEVARHGPYDGYISRVAYSPNGKWIAVARFSFSLDPRGHVALIDRTNGKEIATLRGHLQEIHGLSFTPDSRYLFTGSKDGTALVFDLSKRE